MNNKGNVVIAGDKVFASIEESPGEHLTCVRWAMVIEFDSKEAFQEAWKAGAMAFTIFEDRKP
jgi:hypothetical protein